MRPLQEGAQGELAGLGQAGARLDRAFHGVAQHDGRAVAGDLDHVFRGIGARGLEKGDDHLVDDAPVAVEQVGQVGMPGSPGDGEAQDGVRDGQGVRAGEADDAQAAAPGRSGNGDDRIGKDQRRAAAG